MIAPEALCTCRQTGTVLWVVEARADDGQRRRLRGKRVDHRGRSDVSATGDGDTTVIREVEIYELATTIEHTRKDRRYAWLAGCPEHVKESKR